MEYSRTGIILCTENYRECVSFYSDTLELPVMFSLNNEHSQLTCCDMGSGNYLMIEKGGRAAPGKKSIEQNPVWLRFNVGDVEDAAKQLSKKNVNVNVRREVWGTVADFTDPDGNVCSLRDEASFGQ
ncbi:MAG: VOC family protein [Gammaproteobacteria bacterium]|nr:VOC family protein [Gammaproteobacteria bacterium]